MQGHQPRPRRCRRPKVTIGIGSAGWVAVPAIGATAAARVTAAMAGAPARSTLVAGGEAAAAMVAAVVVVVAVAAVHTGMRAAVGMAAHGTTPARGRIGATVLETADRRHSRIVGVARCGKWQA